MRPCFANKPGQRERERVLGQGGRGGGEPAARAAEGIHLLATRYALLATFKFPFRHQ